MKLRMTTHLSLWKNINLTIVNLESGNGMIVAEMVISRVSGILCWSCLIVCASSFDNPCLGTCSTSLPVTSYVNYFKSCQLSRLMMLLYTVDDSSSSSSSIAVQTLITSKATLMQARVLHISEVYIQTYIPLWPSPNIL